MINSLLKKSNSQTICMQKIRLEMTLYLQILLQSYPQLGIDLSQVNKGLEIYVHTPYLGEFRFRSRLKGIKYPHDICQLFMKLFLFTFITSIDQMIFFQERLQGTASAITTNICLTKYIIGASVTASIWKIVSKNIS